MTKRTVTSLALAAGCALALAIPAAQAQVQSEWSGSAIQNNKESREYMRLLQTNWSFRQNRIRKECGPVTDSQLYENCVASFDIYTPFTGSTRLAGNQWYPPNPQTYNEPPSLRAERGNITTGMTGSSMPTTGTTGYNYNYRDIYQGGYGTSAAPPYAYGTPPYSTDPFAASRNLPAEDTGGMIRAPGAMPHYPGPRPSGPLSGGGS